MARIFTTDECNAMTEEVMLGKPRTVRGKDADEFRKKVAEQIEQMKKDELEVSFVE